MDDDFDIQELRRKLREANGSPNGRTTDRRKPRRDAAATPPEAAGPSLFEWAGVETLVETSPPLDPPIGDAPWPPLVVVPISSANRARPFGRRADQRQSSILDLVDNPSSGAETRPLRRRAISASLFSEDAFSIEPEAPVDPGLRLVRRYAEPTPEVPPDDYDTVVGDADGHELAASDVVDTALEADFVDRVTDAEIAAAEQAAEQLRQTIDRLEPTGRRQAAPAEKLLLNLANTLLLERDQLAARLSDQQAPLILTTLRRRKGERDHVPLATANDRG